MTAARRGLLSWLLDPVLIPPSGDGPLAAWYAYRVGHPLLSRLRPSQLIPSSRKVWDE